MIRAGDLGAHVDAPVVREVADRVRAAGDRQPGLCANGLRSRVELRAHAVHAAGLDPLECRPAPSEGDEVELRVEHVAEAVPAAPVLQGVEIESEHVGARGQCRIHPLPLRECARAAVEVVGQREEAGARSRDLRHEAQRIGGRKIAGKMRVPFVGQVRPDRAGARACGRLRVGEDEGSTPDPAREVGSSTAAVAHEEVDADGEIRSDGVGALRPDHLREGRLLVEQDDSP